MVHILSYDTCPYFGFSALMDYLHVLVVSDVVKTFIHKLNNTNNNNHIGHCTHTSESTNVKIQ